jgi:murein DD-endopeptidase MepM/ murein hydrolase activator NlpD
MKNKSTTLSRRLKRHFKKLRKNLHLSPIYTIPGRVLRARKGNKLSRLFRYVFEHAKIRQILGTNLALLVIATSFVPGVDISTEAYVEKGTATAPLVLTTTKGLRFPVDKVIITQGYKFYHPALDLNGDTGDPIYPIMTGRVEYAEFSRLGYGNAIIINHGNGVTSLYAHLSKFNVVVGQTVSSDMIIGEMGNTGRSFGDHLHLEIRENGKPVNPLIFLR